MQNELGNLREVLLNRGIQIQRWEYMKVLKEKCYKEASVSGSTLRIAE